MISDSDIIRDDTNLGNIRPRLSVRALLRNLILIGQLPRSTTRAERRGAYDGPGADQWNFHGLIPRGFSAERRLRASDVEELSLAEKAAFLKGASLLLSDRLRAGGDCICNMQAIVILPVAAYASLLREDVGLARKSWKAFAKIPRLCAERIELRRPDENSPADLRGLSFDEFIDRLTSVRRDDFGGDEAILGVLAADRIEMAFALANHRGMNGL